MGRVCRLTPERQKTITDLIREGLPYREAGARAGVSADTISRWKRRGELAKSGKFRNFYLEMEQAILDSKAALLGIILKSATQGTQVVETVEDLDPKGKLLRKRVMRRTSPRDWKAAMKMLQARFPEEYGRQVLDHRGSGGVSPTPIVQLIFDDGEGDPNAQQDHGTPNGEGEGPETESPELENTS